MPNTVGFEQCRGLFPVLFPDVQNCNILLFLRDLTLSAGLLPIYLGFDEVLNIVKSHFSASLERYLIPGSLRIMNFTDNNVKSGIGKPPKSGTFLRVSSWVLSQF